LWCFQPLPLPGLARADVMANEARREEIGRMLGACAN
jgi:hypothetical protein